MSRHHGPGAAISAPANPPLLSLRGISKSFGDLRANRAVDLEIAEGEIHALLGENGAGKSTLVKIVCGTLRADAGSVAWRGKEVEIASPAAARELGIGVVFQHFSLFRALTVAENIALGLPAADFAKLRARVKETAARYGIELDPDRPLHTLSVGEWQRVEIVRCLLGEPRLLMLDEPTSVLTPQEADGLFAILRRLAAEGCSVLYISHRLAEIRKICSQATVMRGGEVVARCESGRRDPGEPRRNDDRAQAAARPAGGGTRSWRTIPSSCAASICRRTVPSRRSSRTSACGSTPAGSSASPGSPATARPSSARRCPASCRSRRTASF